MLSTSCALAHFYLEEAKTFSIGHKENHSLSRHRCVRGRDAAATLLDDMGTGASGVQLRQDPG